MKKRVYLVLLVLLLSTVSVLAQTSSENNRQIQIVGCTDFDETLPEEGQDIHFAEVGDCLLPDRRYFCASNDNLKDVFTTPNACTSGSATLPRGGGGTGDPILSEICCPLGEYECIDDVTPGEFLCASRTNPCPDYENENDCTENQCYWDVNTGTCFNPGDSCDTYTTQVVCESDAQGIAFGDANCRADEYEGAGVYLIVPRDSCECVWDATRGCGVRSNVTNVYGSDMTKYALCTFFTEVDNCTDGFENYRHIAIYDPNSMPVSGLLPADVGCANRTGKRRCGEAIVKVPFFNFVNVIFVILMIGLTYIALTKFSVSKK